MKQSSDMSRNWKSQFGKAGHARGTRTLCTALKMWLVGQRAGGGWEQTPNFNKWLWMYYCRLGDFGSGSSRVSGPGEGTPKRAKCIDMASPAASCLRCPPQYISHITHQSVWATSDCQDNRPHKQSIKPFRELASHHGQADDEVT